MAESSRRSGTRFKRLALPVVGIGLSTAGLGYVYRDFDLNSFTASAGGIRVLPLLGTLAAYWLGVVFVRSFLVRHLLSPIGSVPAGAAYRYICIGFLANNVLPFRAGEMARSAAIHRGTGLRFSSVVGGLALERLLDMGMVAAIAFATIRFVPLPEAVRRTAWITAGVVIAGLCAAVFLARRAKSVSVSADKRGLVASVQRLWLRFAEGFSAMSRPSAVAKALGLAVGVWLCALAAMAFRIEAFGLSATPGSTLTLLTCLGFGVAVPSAPGYVGVYHAAAAFALELHGVPHATAGAFALFSWLVDVGVSSAMGAGCLSIEGLKLKDLRQKSSLAPTSPASTTGRR